MSDFTYEYAKRKIPLETYEWDNVWWEHTENTEASRVLYIGDSISCATRSARIKREGNTLDIHLGGIRPFNLLRLTGTDICSMEIEVFNGTDFEPTLFAESGEYRFRRMIDHAYRLRVKVPGCAAEEVVAELFCDPEN